MYGGGSAGPGVFDRQADVSLGDSQSRGETFRQGLYGVLGAAPSAGVPLQGEAAAGSLDKHVKRIFDQGEVSASGAGNGANDIVFQRQEFSKSAAQAKAFTRSPPRLMCAEVTIDTGAIWPIRPPLPSQCTACR